MTRNTFGLNRTLGVAIATIALVALIGSGLVMVSLNQLQAASGLRDGSTQIISGLDAFRTAMLNQETGVRGYLLTGRTSSLEPYVSGRAALEPVIGRLRQETSYDEGQGALLEQAVHSARDWQTNIGERIVVEMTSQGSRDHARSIESTGEGKRHFDSFREKLNAIERHEDQSLAVQGRIVQRAERVAMGIAGASAIVTLLICLGVGLAISRVITRPLIQLARTMNRLVQRDTDVTVPSLRQRNEVGAMARAVEVFRNSLVELDRTSLLRTTADTLPAMVGYIDATRQIGFLNGEFERWFAFGGEDVSQQQGRPIEQVFPRGSFPGGEEHLSNALHGEEARIAIRLTRIDGAARDLEAFFKPHLAPDGRVLGVVTLITDVSDRKDIDRQLRHQAHDLQRSNEELEQFAYVASHDLKAPLRGIENLASWIEEDLGDALSGDTRKNMDLLRSRVRRLESLLNDLLAYSRAGRADTVVRTVDTRALVDELAVLVSPPAGFAIEASPDLPTVRAVAAALTQALQNLIGNAIKHHGAPATGHVWIEAERRDDKYEFRVCDDGPGVPEQFRERVFGMFQTLRPRDEVEGSGMGLAIVKKLVERQGGAVWLSDRPAGGLVVHFTWPIEPGEF